MRVYTYNVGIFMTNCYIVEDETTGKAVVIDPGGVTSGMLDRLKLIGYDNIEYILLTHCHFDHISGVCDLLDILPNALVAVHSTEGGAMADPRLNGTWSFEICLGRVPKADVLYNDGDIITCGSLSFKVMHTPGHTAGSSCFICGDCIFSGDTLFAGSAGRTDLPSGDRQALLRSLKRLCDFREKEGRDFNVYPGHEESTTLDYERDNNPYYGSII